MKVFLFSVFRRQLPNGPTRRHEIIAESLDIALRGLRKSKIGFPGEREFLMLRCAIEIELNIYIKGWCQVILIVLKIGGSI